jgi:PAS domain S-box-containing protein
VSGVAGAGGAGGKRRLCYRRAREVLYFPVVGGVGVGVKSLRKAADLRFTDVRRFCCLLPLVLTTGSLNLARLYADANLYWIIVTLLALFAVIGTLLYFYPSQIGQHRRDTAETAELHASNAALGEHEQRFRDQLAETRMALEVAHAGAFSIDSTTGRIAWSDELHHIYGLKPGEFGGRWEEWLECVLPEDRALDVACVSGASSEFRIRRRNDGEVRWLEARGQVLFDSAERSRRIIGINVDVTERRRAKEEMRALEDQFRHAQKMEAIGRLAGGVAHDFNNLLMVIRSFTELLQERLPADEDLHRYTREVLNASARAAGLTTQLLAFSRKQVLNPTVLNLNTVVNDATKMLKRLLGDDLHFQVLADESLWGVRADADQIVQVMMNLCVNSRDAMPRGGAITVQTRNSTVSESGLTDNTYVAPGEYVALSVEDTGVGMSKQDMEHIFDPFFTTKPVGGGTGLGLATVYDIVKQSNGYVWAASEIGKGTRFTIYLPRAKEAVVPALPIRPEMAHLRGNETVLVVENETLIREGMCEFLQRRGYTVLSADSGEEALLISGRYHGTIDLLIADLVLAQMGGLELSQRLIELRPEVKVIHMSGHADSSGLNITERQHAKAFLQKPFGLTKLAQTIRDVLTNADDDSESRPA